MPMCAMIEKKRTSENERGTPRLHMRLEAPGSVEGSGSALVVIHNLSATGMLIETASDLAIGQRIMVALPEAPDCAATVVWRSEALAGCRFDRPLSHAMLSAAQLRNPLPGDFDPEDATGALEYTGSGLLLAERLHRLRRDHGLSRAALSERTGLSRPSIWAWETGKTVPRKSSIIALAQAFGITAREIVTGGLEAGACENPEARGTAEQIQCLVDDSKQRIAAFAGVEIASVKITIEF